MQDKAVCSLRAYLMAYHLPAGHLPCHQDQRAAAVLCLADSTMPNSRNRAHTCGIGGLPGELHDMQELLLPVF